MATKTLSVDEEACLRLVRARQDRRESFSAVIKRARWDRGKKRCGDLLARASGRVPGEVLDALDGRKPNIFLLPTNGTADFRHDVSDRFSV